MTDTTERQYGRRAVEFGPTGETVAANIAQLRKIRGYTTRGLSAELRKYGRVIPPSAISRMESARRHVTVDDLMALASIFDVSPSALLLPLTDDPSTRIPITGAGMVPADQAWDWTDGRRRLDRPCPDPGAAALEFAIYSRPPIRRNREVGA
ncbi:helix-turn-helix domain-containing protein [Streptomyces sp. NPDC020747]|uniref:helix-turn-helix domain-containing protein n=1 Tax=Streptomyces sp. NPDC020747 TaxID=3365086 RepID=UPI0037B07897